MSKWEIVKLEECFTLSSGRFLPAKKRVEGEYSVFGGNGIIGKHNEYFIDNPTVVIGRVGEYCGSVHTTGEKVWITDNALYATRFLKNLDRDFICYALNQKNLNSFANKSGQPSISQSAILKIGIPLPPLEIQKQIAKTLDTAAELLAMRKQQLAELDNLIRSTIYDMFGDPVANEKGWESKNLGQVAKFIQGTQVPLEYQLYENNKQAVRFLRISDYTQETDDLRYIIPTGKEFVCASDDVIMVRYGASAGYVGCGFDGIIANNLFAVSPFRNDINKKYLLYFLRNERINEIIVQSANQSAMPALSHKNMATIRLIIPPWKLQMQFAEIVTKIEEQKALVQKAIDETQYLFDSLMSEYFD